MPNHLPRHNICGNSQPHQVNSLKSSIRCELLLPSSFSLRTSPIVSCKLCMEPRSDAIALTKINNCTYSGCRTTIRLNFLVSLRTSTSAMTASILIAHWNRMEDERFFLFRDNATHIAIHEKHVHLSKFMQTNKRCEEGPCGKQCKRQQKHWEIPEFIIIAFDTHTVPESSVPFIVSSLFHFVSSFVLYAPWASCNMYEIELSRRCLRREIHYDDKKRRRKTNKSVEPIWIHLNAFAQTERWDETKT